MKTAASFILRMILSALGVLLSANFVRAQGEPQGHSIGKVSTDGNLVVVELNDGALRKANMFDLTGRTLHLTPEGSRYRVENGPLQWDPDFGAELTGSDVTLTKFAFPFSGKTWNSFRVGVTGSISFGDNESDADG